MDILPCLEKKGKESMNAHMAQDNKRKSNRMSVGYLRY